MYWYINSVIFLEPYNWKHFFTVTIVTNGIKVVIFASRSVSMACALCTCGWFPVLHILADHSRIWPPVPTQLCSAARESLIRFSVFLPKWNYQRLQSSYSPKSTFQEVCIPLFFSKGQQLEASCNLYHNYCWLQSGLWFIYNYKGIHCY